MFVVVSMFGGEVFGMVEEMCFCNFESGNVYFGVKLVVVVIDIVLF